MAIGTGRSEWDILDEAVLNDDARRAWVLERMQVMSGLGTHEEELGSAMTETRVLVGLCFGEGLDCWFHWLRP